MLLARSDPDLRDGSTRQTLQQLTSQMMTQHTEAMAFADRLKNVLIVTGGTTNTTGHASRFTASCPVRRAGRMQKTRGVEYGSSSEADRNRSDRTDCPLARSRPSA